MDWLDGLQGKKPMPLAPDRQFCDRPGVGLTCIRVSNVGGKEFDEPFGRVGRRSEKGGEFPGSRYY